jgi:leader peptidase (prepilin peptidase)/N-methyltransferase
LLLDPDLLTDPDFLKFTAFVMLLIGPCLGSFASAIAHRSPRHQSWVFSSGAAGKTARSCCPQCGEQLKWFDLLPIVSWLFLKGRCRKCAKPISPLYPALELGAMMLSLAFLFTQGLTFTFLMSLFALPFLLALFVISWDVQGVDKAFPAQILGVLLALSLTLGAGQAFYSDHAAMLILDKILGGAGFAIFGLMLAWMRRSLFRGLVTSPAWEISLLAVAGLWLGISSLPVFLIGAGLYGAVMAVVRLAIYGAKKKFGQSAMLHAFIASFMMTMAFKNQILVLLIP